MATTPKVVFDTQIFLRALINPKSASGRLVIDVKGDYELFTTHQINQEIVDVLNRPKIREKFLQITDEKVDSIKTLLELANQIEITPDEIEPICRDPKDDIFLACAKKANAKYLVSEDKDLLVLEKHHDTVIVNVIDFLRTLETD